MDKNTLQDVFSFDKAIDRHKTKLLDISRRNQLLNFRFFKRSTVKIVDEIPSEIFKDMVVNGKKYDFLPIIETEEDHELDISLESIEHHVYDSKDLEGKHTDTSLQTNQNLKDLLLGLRNIQSKSREFVEEKGVNVLFLALGMIKWQDEKSSVDNWAPIVLIPVELSRKSAKSKFFVRYTGDEIIINPAIEYKLKTDYSIILEDIEVDEKFQLVSYFENLKNTLKDLNDWKLYNNCALGLFAFNKYVMYKDADKYKDIYKNNRIALATLGDLNASKKSNIKPYPLSNELDKKTNPEKTYQILDADSSQQEAIEAVKAGNDIIIQGPPGTGKSQTITNLIGELIGNKKTVLFVCEKMPALNVVYSRLKQEGLSAKCLELHSDKKNRKYFIEQIKDAMNLKSNNKMSSDFIHTLKAKRDKLSEYSKTIHTIDKKFAKTPFWVIGNLVKHKKTGFIKDLPIEVKDYNYQTLIDQKDSLNALKVDYDKFGNILDHPLYGVQITSTGEIIRTEINDILTKTDTFFELLLNRISGLEEQTSILIENFDELKKYNDLLLTFQNIPKISKELFEQEDLNVVNTYIDESNEPINIRNEKEHKILEHYNRSIFELDIDEKEDTLIKSYPTFFRYLKPSYYEFVKKIKFHLRENSSKKNSGIFDSYSNILTLIDNLKKFNYNQSIIDQLEKDHLNHMLGDLWKNKDTNISYIKKGIDWLKSFKKLEVKKTDKKNLMRHILDKDLSSKLVTSNDELIDIAFKKISPLLEKLNVKANINETIFYSDNFTRAEFETIHAKINGFLENFIDLVDWKNLNLRLNKLEELNLERIVDHLLVKRIDPEHYSKQFERTILLNVFEQIKDDNLILKEFEADVHREIELQFKQYDKQLMEYAKYEILYNLDSSNPKADEDWKPAEGGDYGYINKQILAKKGGHSVRKIFGKQAEMIQKICPCFMMSPLSACQYIDPDILKFDYVIFDEASQMTPEDSLSSIVRGKKVVIAGDTKQLPPTSFFNNLGHVDLDENDDTIVEFDSILEAAKGMGIIEKTLRWHYRSRHEALISFSNINFYRNQLNTFPSPYYDGKEFGISYTYVEGYYDRTRTKTVTVDGEKKKVTSGSATNKNEAKAVAEAAYEHYKHFDTKSLGIGAFSSRQQNAIKDCIEELRFQHYDFDQWCNSGPQDKTEEKLFIKNLETIQGDERDVIFISMGYAKDKEGVFRMGFGPLNQKNGERRLNVLVTRAKEKVRFFSSVRSSDFDLSKTESRGAKLLHQYIKYAESNGDVSTLDNPYEYSSEVDQDNIFQQGVANELKDLGYQIKEELGQAGYRIDIAIIDPNNKSKFLLAVECDGASYHSSSTARDRDRIRQSVLENLGWRFHRIWSTDWFQNPDAEMKKLENAIHNIQNNKKISLLEHLKIKQGVKGAHMIDVSEHKPKKSSISILPYENTPISYLGDKDDLYNIFRYNPEKIRDLITEIIKVESPVHLSTIGERIRTAYAFGNVGQFIAKEIKSNTEKVIYHSRGKFIKSQDISFVKSNFYLTIPVERCIRSRENPKTVRDFNHIHYSEILYSFLYTLDNEIRITEESMMFKVREIFGFKTSGSKIKNRIKACLQRAFDDGFIAQENGKICKGEKPIKKLEF